MTVQKGSHNPTLAVEAFGGIEDKNALENVAVGTSVSVERFPAIAVSGSSETGMGQVRV